MGSRQTTRSLLTASVGTQTAYCSSNTALEDPRFLRSRYQKHTERRQERLTFHKGNCLIVVASCVMTYQAGQREIIPEEVIQDQCADQVIHRPLESLGCTVDYLLGPVGELNAALASDPQAGLDPESCHPPRLTSANTSLDPQSTLMTVESFHGYQIQHGSETLHLSQTSRCRPFASSWLTVPRASENVTAQS